jgi:protein gp37
MAKITGIAWCHSTFNCWIGCTKVGPGCDGCYAEALDRARLSKTLGGGTPTKPIIHWGTGAPRYRTSVQNWNAVRKWDRQAKAQIETGVMDAWRVFCASLADVFDNEAPDEWRWDLWTLIADTPHLSWLLVTKRIGNVAKMVPQSWMTYKFPPNVRLMITVVNQEEADRDVPKLLELKCKNGISYVPALGAVGWARWLRTNPLFHSSRGIEWIIVGGESAQAPHQARPFELAWARSTIKQCCAAGVPVFVKQIGSRPQSNPDEARQYGMMMRDRAGATTSEWPADLRVQEFPK